MPTIVQAVIRKTVVTLLTTIWSIYAVVGLIISAWKYSKQPGKSLLSIFEKKNRQRPKVLDSEDWTHGYVRLTQVRMHYVESGDTSKPLIIFIHGFPEFWYSYRFQIRYFSKDYHVIALDLRGYAESDKPSGIANYDLEILAKDVAEFIEKTGKKAIVVGHDWGAAVAWTLAMHHVEVIANRLIILNVPHPKAFAKVIRTRSAQLWKSWYIFFYQCPILPELIFRAMDYQFLETVFRNKKMGIINAQNFTDEDLEAWKYTFSQADSVTPIINFYRASMRAIGERTFSSELIKPKTLIIWGEKDVALDVYGAELSLTLCRDAYLERIPNASHWVQQDAPELVNKLIENFIKD